MSAVKLEVQKPLAPDEISSLRVVLGVIGAISVIAGILLLAWPQKTIAVAAGFLGAYFLASALVRLAIAIFAKGSSAATRSLDVVVGLLLLLLGIFTLRNLSTSSAALLLIVVLVVGIGWVAEGIHAIYAFRSSPAPVWSIVAGVLNLFAGVFVLVAPGISASFLIAYSAVALVILGVVGPARAFRFGSVRRTSAAA